MTLSCKERMTGNWLQQTEAVSKLKYEEFFQAAEGRTCVLVLCDTGRGTNAPAHPGSSMAPCGVSPGAGGPAGDDVAPNPPKETAA